MHLITFSLIFSACSKFKVFTLLILYLFIYNAYHQMKDVSYFLFLNLLFNPSFELFNRLNTFLLSIFWKFSSFLLNSYLSLPLLSFSPCFFSAFFYWWISINDFYLNYSSYFLIYSYISFYFYFSSSLGYIGYSAFLYFFPSLDY